MGDPPNQNRSKSGRKNNVAGGQNGNQDYANNGNRNTNNNNYNNKSNQGNVSELTAGVHVQVHNHSYSHSYSHTHAQIYPPNFVHPQQAPQLPVAPPTQTPIIVNGGGANTKLNSSVTVFSSVSVQHQQQQMPPQQQPPLLQHPPRPQGERVHVNNVINQVDMHSFWTYGTAAFMQPMLAPPNMPPISYGIPSNAVQYQAMPVYTNGPPPPPPQPNAPPMHAPPPHVNAGANQALVSIQHGPPPQPPPPPPPGAPHYPRLIQSAPPQQPLLQQQQQQQQQQSYHDVHHQQQFHNPYQHNPMQQRPLPPVPHMARKDPQMMATHMSMPSVIAASMPAPSFEPGRHQLLAQDVIYEEVGGGDGHPPPLQDSGAFSQSTEDAPPNDKQPLEVAVGEDEGESLQDQEQPEEKTADIGNCCLAEDNFLWSAENSENVSKSEDVVDVVAINEGGGDASIINASMDIEGMLRESHTKFHDFFRLALRGSEIAEKLAFVHRNRPCFKKMDSLCARIKQDLIRSDNVLPNINSQGLVWAVKDFIFVFTRIINAWVIVKGYVYNTPEGLSTVKAALSTDFPANFIAWQSATSDFIDSLTRSFINLDNLVQMRSTYQRADIGGGVPNVVPNGPNNRNNLDPTSSPPPPPPPPVSQGGTLESNVSLSSFAEEKGEDETKECSGDKDTQGNCREENNYHFTIRTNPEKDLHEINMSGTYLKTGTYLPLQKENVMENAAAPITSPPKCESSSGGATAPSGEQQRPASWSSNKDFGSFVISATNMRMMNASTNPSTPSIHDIQYEGDDPNRLLSEELMEKLNVIIENLMSMHTADLFFKTEFIRNYFPQFLEAYQGQFIDVRSIILKCQTGGYMSMDEVVHDVRRIIYHVNLFLKNNYNLKLYKTIEAFEKEFNEIFNVPPFVPGEYDYITGDPSEILKPHQR